METERKSSKPTHIGLIMVKVLMITVLTGLTLFYETQLLTSQFGFCSGNGCNDDIYAIKQLQGITYIYVRMASYP